jgi:hypothetical protein
MTGGRTRESVLALISVLLLAGIVALFFHRLEASRAVYVVNNCVLGADNASIGAALDQGRYNGLKWRKHPLAVALVAAVAEPLAQAGMSHRRATSLALALLVGVGAVAMFQFLARFVASPLTALTSTVFFLGLFGPLTLFSVTDSYGVTFAASAVAVLAMGLMARRGSALTSGVRSGLAIAVAGLANPPALAIFPLHAALRRSHGEADKSDLLVDLAVPAAVAALIAVGVPLALSGGWGIGYAQRYADIAGFRDVRVLSDYASGFLIQSLVAPTGLVQCRYPAEAMSAASPARLAAAALALLVLCAGLARSLASSTGRPLAMASLAGTAMLFLFYLWFNPGEVLLYSSQWLFLLVLGATAGFSGWWMGLPLVATMLNLTLNLPPLLRPESADPARCCPHPPPTMLDREHPRAHARRLCSRADAE